MAIAYLEGAFRERAGAAGRIGLRAGRGGPAEPPWAQYSFLITKKDPRIVPASLDFCLANLNREASSAGTSIPSESLNPTARFLASSVVYITLIDRPLS